MHILIGRDQKKFCIGVRSAERVVASADGVVLRVVQVGDNRRPRQRRALRDARLKLQALALVARRLRLGHETCTRFLACVL